MAEFPWILDVFGLQPFEFFKVIESFVKVDPALPQPVVKVSGKPFPRKFILFTRKNYHFVCFQQLFALEDQIVESLAWKKV